MTDLVFAWRRGSFVSCALIIGHLPTSRSKASESLSSAFSGQYCHPLERDELIKAMSLQWDYAQFGVGAHEPLNPPEYGNGSRS